MSVLYGDTAGPCRVLFDNSPKEVDMDGLYDTFMPYGRKRRTAGGELSSCSISHHLKHMYMSLATRKELKHSKVIRSKKKEIDNEAF